MFTPRNALLLLVFTGSYLPGAVSADDVPPPPRPNPVFACAIENQNLSPDMQAEMPRGLGYAGPIGLQCSGISGDVRDNLKRSMNAWRKTVGALSATWNQPPPAFPNNIQELARGSTGAPLLGNGVRIVSERGRDCTVQNPWPGRSVVVVRNGTKAETIVGERLSLKTTPGETIVLAPATP